MFSKIFTVSFLLAFFVMAANCSQYPYYPPYNNNDNYLSGQAGRGPGGGGALGEVQSHGGPAINVNPVNNAESHSDSSPYSNQRAEHVEYPQY